MVAVWLIGAKHPGNFIVAGQKAFFRDQKNFFLKKFVESSCKEGRGQTMWGSGQNMVQNDQTQRTSVYMM
jgi:hypothetical protein